MRKTILAAAVAAVAALPVSAATLSDYFSSFFVLGDSLSDNGNLGDLLPPPYYNNPENGGDQFSNGPVYSDILDDGFVTPGTTRNYAFGGAEAVSNDTRPVPDLPLQKLLFLTDTTIQLGSNPLVAIWAGANDIFGAIGRLSDPIAAAETAAREVAKTIGEIAAAKPIRKFLVMNLPDLGQTAQFKTLNFTKAGKETDPIAKAAALQAAALAQGAATLASNAYNAELSAQLALLDPQLQLFQVDVFSLFGDILSGVVDIGVTEFDDPCFISDPAESPTDSIFYCGPADALTRLFFDGVHPNSAAHAELARRIQALAAVPVPGTLPLLAGALVIGAGVIRRRRTA